MPEKGFLYGFINEDMSYMCRGARPPLYVDEDDFTIYVFLS